MMLKSAPLSPPREASCKGKFDSTSVAFGGTLRVCYAKAGRGQVLPNYLCSGTYTESSFTQITFPDTSRHPARRCSSSTGVGRWLRIRSCFFLQPLNSDQFFNCLELRVSGQNSSAFTLSSRYDKSIRIGKCILGFDMGGIQD